MRLGSHRLGEPGLHLARTPFGDHVPLSVWGAPGLRVTDQDLAVARQSSESRIHLTEGQRLSAAEVGVVVALEVIAVAGFSFQQAEQGNGDGHQRTVHHGYTSSV